jgi:hypothetical protein
VKNRVLGALAAALALGGEMGAMLPHGSIPSGPAFRGGRHGRSRIPGKANPPGTKVAKRVMKARGLQWKGEIFHGGDLTKASNARSLKRLERRLIDNAAMVSFPHIIIPQEKASA